MISRSLTAGRFTLDAIGAGRRATAASVIRRSTGIDTIERIRAATRPSLPAVIYSGETAPEVLKEVAMHGIELLPKPIRESRLVALMAKHRPARRTTSDALQA